MKRNEDVLDYRLGLLKKLSKEDFDNLPSYDEMYNSRKELIDSNWLNNK